MLVLRPFGKILEHYSNNVERQIGPATDTRQVLARLSYGLGVQVPFSTQPVLIEPSPSAPYM